MPEPSLTAPANADKCALIHKLPTTQPYHEEVEVRMHPRPAAMGLSNSWCSQFYLPQGFCHQRIICNSSAMLSSVEQCPKPSCSVPRHALSMTHIAPDNPISIEPNRNVPVDRGHLNLLYDPNGCTRATPCAIRRELPPNTMVLTSIVPTISFPGVFFNRRTGQRRLDLAPQAEIGTSVARPRPSVLATID